MLRAQEANPTFTPAQETMRAVQDQVATEDEREILSLQRANHRAMSLSGTIMRTLRCIYPPIELDWWCINALAKCLRAEILNEPRPSLASFARYSKIPKRELEDHAEKMPVDSAALMLLFLDEKAMSDLGIPITASVRKRSKELIRQIREVRKLMDDWGNVPWFDRKLSTVENEHRR